MVGDPHSHRAMSGIGATRSESHESSRSHTAREPRVVTEPHGHGTTWPRRMPEPQNITEQQISELRHSDGVLPSREACAPAATHMHVGLWVHICFAPHIYVGLSLLLHVPHMPYRSVPTSLCRPTDVSRSACSHLCVAPHMYIGVHLHACVYPCTGTLGVRLHDCVAAGVDFCRCLSGFPSRLTWIFSSVTTMHVSRD